MATIGQLIRQLRKSANLTQRDLAAKTGINFTYLSRIENDRLDSDQTPRPDTLRTIAQALSADADELLLAANRVPDSMGERILAKPTLFRRVMNLSDEQLEELVAEIEK